jgi:hypothetical protein
MVTALLLFCASWSWDPAWRSNAQQILALLAIAFGIVFSRLRSGYGAPGEKPIHVSQARTLAPL